MSASAPASSGASVISRTGAASSSRSSSARSGSRREEASCVPSRFGERNGPSRCMPRMRGRLSADRHLRHRLQHLLLRARDQRRQIRSHAGLEERLACPAVAVGIGVEEVDAAEAVHLQVDEPGHGDPASPRAAEPDARHDAPVDLDVAQQQACCRRALPRRQVSCAPVYEWSGHLVNTSSPYFAVDGVVSARAGLYHRTSWPRSASTG